MDLQQIVKELRKKFGDSIIRSGDEIPDVRRIPIKELPMFDYASGGGLMHNRVNEFVGEKGSLKSWVMYKYIGIYQHMEWSTHTLNVVSKIAYDKNKNIKDITFRKGKKFTDPIVLKSALIDYEHTYTPAWGKKLGIDTEGLIVSQPDRLSTGVDIAEALCADESIGLVCIDSLSALGTDEEIDNSMENQQMGVAARFWNKAIRKLQAALNRNPNSNATLIVINSKYATMSQYTPDKIRNGEQLERSKSLSMEFRALKPLSEKVDGIDTIIGRNVVLKCLKNKGGGPTGRTGNFFYGEIDYDFTLANNTDYINQIIELAVRGGIVERLGNSYIYEKYKVTGMAGFVKKIANEEVFIDITKRVYDEVINTIV